MIPLPALATSAHLQLCQDEFADFSRPKVSVYSETGGSLGWAENDFKVPITEGEDWAACVNGYGSHERAGYIALAAGKLALLTPL